MLVRSCLWYVKELIQDGDVVKGRAQAVIERLRCHRGLLAVVLFAEMIAIITTSTIDLHNHVDGEVYQLGAKTLLAGQNIYQDLPATETGLWLPFIYPPFAAFVFAPLAIVPKPVAIMAITLISHVALLVTLYVLLSACTFLREHREHVFVITAAVLPLVTLTEPVWETIGYAQINIVLLAMIAVDCLWRVNSDRMLPYPRGLLIGLAAGIKLTPAVFLLFFVLRKDYRAVLVSMGTFIATALLGFALGFRQAMQFWTSEVFASSQMSFGQGFTGNTGVYAGNQSLRAVLTKLGLTPPTLTIAMVVLGALVLGLGVLGMFAAFREYDLPMAMSINAVIGLLLSPISWSHHWVLALPALVLLCGGALVRRDWALLLASSMAAGFFYLAAHWDMPQGKGKELRWNAFEHLVGSAYVWLGLGLLLYAGHRWWRSRRSSRAAVAVEPERAAG